MEETNALLREILAELRAIRRASDQGRTAEEIGPPDPAFVWLGGPFPMAGSPAHLSPPIAREPRGVSTFVGAPARLADEAK